MVCLRLFFVSDNVDWTTANPFVVFGQFNRNTPYTISNILAKRILVIAGRSRANLSSMLWIDNASEVQTLIGAGITATVDESAGTVTLSTTSAYQIGFMAIGQRFDT